MAKSVMEHQFSEVPHAEIPRSSFNRSHGLKTTFDADELVPILIDDIIPGDTFNVNCTHFARLGSPLLHPIMDNLYLETFFFFVPYRLVWDNWEKFCGSQDNPGDSIDFTIPSLGTTDYNGVGVNAVQRLLDHFGLPHHVINRSEFTALPFRAYNLIYNEWFRDENLQNSLVVDTTDGPDDIADYEVRKRGKRHDYFTSCLPWPQKGTAVSLPLIGNAPIKMAGGLDQNASVFSVAEAEDRYLDTDSAFAHISATEAPVSTGDLYADLASVTAATVNDLRLAFQTQRLLERDARAGTRYVEMLKAHYGVTSPDFRLQRPEFLGGGSSQIITHEVPNTSDTATIKQAELAAFGTSTGSAGFTQSFVEHGLIIGLANVRGDITYSQGAERFWFKKTRYDFFYPVLSMIGEQSVPNWEIWYNNASTDNDVFGYQERYAEYRYKPSRLTGLFRPDAAGSLESWHLSEDFTSLPTLGATFIESNTAVPLDRAISVPAEPQIIADFFFDMKCARPMPLYGVPGNLDHF